MPFDRANVISPAVKANRRLSSNLNPQPPQPHHVKSHLESEPYALGVQHDVRYKVVLIGNSTVGKSSLLRHWRGDPFEPCLMPTVGLDFAGRIYNMEEGRLRLDVWDTAGQERYGAITSVHYRDAKGFIFVYDITNRDSFERLGRHWLTLADDYLDVGDSIPIFIVGNKADLRDSRQVSSEEGRRFAELQSASGFYETSARTGSGVLEMFHSVASAVGHTWGLLRLLCDDEAPLAGGRNCASARERCDKCGRSHKRKGFHLRLQTLRLKGRSGMKDTRCCSGRPTGIVE